MLTPEQDFLFTRQIHDAKRAGRHYDIRLVAGDKAYSWATKKELPESGKSILLYEQPVHDASYALSQRVEIPEGQYGAGTTVLDFVRKGRVGAHSTPEQLTIQAGEDKYLLKKLLDEKYGKKAWLFKNLGGNKYLEKAAMLITQYLNPETGVKTWVPETQKTPPGQWLETGAKKYLRKKKVAV